MNRSTNACASRHFFPAVFSPGPKLGAKLSDVDSKAIAVPSCRSQTVTSQMVGWVDFRWQRTTSVESTLPMRLC